MKTMPKPLIVVQTQNQLQDLFHALRISPTFDLEKGTLQIWLRTIGFELAIAPGFEDRSAGQATDGRPDPDLPDPIILQGDGRPAQIDLPQPIYDKLVKAKIEQLIDAAFLTVEDLFSKGFTPDEIEALAELIVGSGLRAKLDPSLWPAWLKTKGEKEFEASQGFTYGGNIIDFPKKP
jgi:hypothetical protein